MENHFGIEKKLELMQQVRSRYDRDQNDMIHREMLLYGKTGNVRTIGADPYSDQMENHYMSQMQQTSPAQDEQPFSTFTLRVLLSAGLFLLLIICDISNKNFFGIPATQCFQAISKDYESSITQWVNAASDDFNGSLTP